MDETSHTYCVPVRAAGGTGALVLWTGRLPQGTRVGIAFTTPDRLAAAMGGGQPWIRLSAQALRAMLTPLGIGGIQLDPLLVAAAFTDSRRAVAPARVTRRRMPVGAGIVRG